MEINKPVRTYCLKQLISLVDVARNTTGSRGTKESLRVRFSSFHLSALLHVLSESQKGSLIMSYNSKMVARIPGGLHPSRFKTSGGVGGRGEAELSVFVPTSPVSPAIHFDKTGFSYVCAWTL